MPVFYSQNRHCHLSTQGQYKPGSKFVDSLRTEFPIHHRAFRTVQHGGDSAIGNDDNLSVVSK